MTTDINCEWAFQTDLVLSGNNSACCSFNRFPGWARAGAAFVVAAWVHAALHNLLPILPPLQYNTAPYAIKQDTESLEMSLEFSP